MYHDLIGKPFKSGGRGPDNYDCYGLAKEVFYRHGIVLPDFICDANDSGGVDEIIAGEKWVWQEVSPPLPIPCIVVIRFNEAVLCNHVGVYIGDGKFIHTREKIGVNIDRIKSPAWERKIEGFYVRRSQ